MRRPVDRLAVVVVASKERLARVDAHPNTNRGPGRPLLSRESALRVGRGGRRRGSGLEDTEGAVAFALVPQHNTTVLLDAARDERVVLGQRSVHGALGSLPQSYRVDHIREEETQLPRWRRSSSLPVGDDEHPPLVTHGSSTLKNVADIRFAAAGRRGRWHMARLTAVEIACLARRTDPAAGTSPR